MEIKHKVKSKNLVFITQRNVFSCNLNHNMRTDNFPFTLCQKAVQPYLCRLKIINSSQLIACSSKLFQMATTADISRGMIISLDGSLYSVVEFGENKTARAAAKVWAKLKGV